MNLARRVSPASEVIQQMSQGVPVLCKDEQPPTTVLQFIKLGFRQAFAERREFGISGMVTHAACLRKQIPQRGNLSPKLIEFNRRRELVRQKVAFGIVEIVFILLGVRKSALNLCKPFRTLRRR
ncbi:MAG: hypothetical protein ABSH52_27030 [Terriglobia bacterium]